MNGRAEWVRKKQELCEALENLGFPAELGEAAARHLGSPQAMDRFIAYLKYVKPRTAELVVDEMLAIRSEIDAWRAKKEAEALNQRYNEILWYGLGNETDDEEEPDA